MYRKPRSVRRHYAFWYAVGVTAVIALIWVVSLQHRLSSTETIVDDEQRGAFAAFWDETMKGFVNIFPEDESTASTSASSTDAFGDDGNQEITEFLNSVQERATTTPNQRRSVQIATTSDSGATATNTRQ